MGTLSEIQHWKQIDFQSHIDEIRNKKHWWAKTSVGDFDWNAAMKLIDTHPVDFYDWNKEKQRLGLNSMHERQSAPHFAKEIVKDMRGFFTENRITNIAFCGFGANSQSYPTHADAMDVLLLQVVGDCDITVDNEDRTMRPGDIVYIPRGTNHHIQPTMSRVTYSFGVEGDADPSDYIGRP